MNASQTITLQLSQEKAQGLFDLLEVATKAGGLQAAKLALPIVDDLMQAIQASREAGKESDEKS